MAFDTKPNLSNDKFEQFSGETLTLLGTTEVHGRFEVESGGTFQLNDGNQQDGYVMTSNTIGEVSWEAPTSESVKKEISQTAHGFAVGDVVAYSGTTFVKAIADNTQDGETLGIVSISADTNTFSFITVGFVENLVGLSANTTYYVSDSVAGTLTATQPVTVGSLNKPILVTTISTEGYVLNYRAMEITSGSTSGGIITGTTGVTIVGDDSTTGFTINHGFGSRDVMVQIYENQSPYGNPIVDIERTDINNVDIKFDTAPATATDYRVIILKI